MTLAGLFLLNHLYWFWIIIMILCILIETGTLALTTIWFALGALVMVFVSLTGLTFKWQLLLFILISCILLVLTRPIALKKLEGKKESRTNVDALIGEQAPVTTAIERFKKGEIKYNGSFWPAAGKDGMEIPVGTVCRIISIQGNTATVEPV